MGNCLYNDRELPNINSVYTPELQQSHPHSYISRTALGYILILSPVPVIQEADGGITVPQDAGTVKWLQSRLSSSDDTEWGEFTEREQYYGNTDLVDPFWGNTDILNEDGTLYLAASKPVPVSPVQINPALLVQNFFVGQAIRRMRGKPVAHTHAYTPAVTAPTCTEKGFTTYTCACGDSYTAEETEALGHAYVSEVVEPTTETEGYTLHTCSRCGDSYKDNYTEKLKLVGYKYGDSPTLPDINEVWLYKDSLPHAVIFTSSSVDNTCVWFLAKRPYYKNGNLYSSSTSGNAMGYKLVDGAWTLYLNLTLNPNILMGVHIWSNCDIYDVGNTVLHFAASDPVPVYE